MHIIPAAADPIVVIAAALIVGLAALFIYSSTPNGPERTLRLLFLYLTYGTLEIVVKRGAHYVWYLYPIKFALFFLVLLAWSASRGRGDGQRTSAPLKGVLVWYLGLAAIQVFNPYQTSAVVGLLGWLSDFIFVTFYFVAVDLFDDPVRVRRLLRVTACLGVLSAAACFFEQWWGPDELFRDYPTYTRLLYFTEQGIRIRPSALSAFMEIFGIAALLGLAAARQIPIVLAVVGIIACATANALHVVRIAWVVGFATVALMQLTSRQRRLFSVAAAVVAVVVAVRIGTQVTEGLITPSFESLQRPVTTFSKTRSWGLVSLSAVVRDYPFGAGIGESSPGLRLIDSTGVVTFGLHNYLTELAAQMSLAGPLLLLMFCGGVLLKTILAAWRAQRGERQVYLSVGVGMFGALAVSLFIGGGLGNFPLSDYFWLLAGATMSLAGQRQTVVARVAAPSTYLRPSVIRPAMRLN
jgi:hypothetical protein